MWAGLLWMGLSQSAAAQAELGDPQADQIANTARAVSEPPGDTVITHRTSALRRQVLHGSEEGNEVLPARTEASRTSRWYSDGWYLTGLLSLAAVLGLIFLISYLARRFVLPGARLGSRELEVLARTYVGNKQSIAVVKIGRRVIVVGIAGNRISLLATLDDPSEASELIGRLASSRPDSLSRRFSGRLEEEAQRFREAEAGEPPYRDSHPEFTQRAHRQLRAAIDRMRALGRRQETNEGLVPGEHGNETRIAG
jgi:flagellar biosynthetic protein FliO